jgi:hypothetical protein
MKKCVLLLLGLLFLSGWVSAYQVDISAPDSLAVGKPLVVTGTTTFGIGTPIDVVLYYQLTTTTEIQRKIVYVQSDKSFKAVFDTTGMKTGIYKVEVPANGQGGDSITMRLITLFDRSEDIHLSSTINQSFSGTLYVAGEITGDENTGVQIEAFDSEGTVVFGPRYINVNSGGKFSAEIPITEPGDYEISFTDSKGYIGSRTVTAVGSAIFGAITPATVATTNPVLMSAHTRASRDNPAYFIVKTGNGPVTLYTSKSMDWVIEYIDEKGILHMSNSQGDRNPEEVEFLGKGKTIYVKVYPYKYSLTSDVLLYGENVDSLSVSPTVPEPFAASEPETTTPEAPLLPFAGVSALCIALLLSGRKDRS